MKKLILFGCACLVGVCASAETIKLKSGEEYKGKIIDRNENYVTIQTNGAPIYLPVDQIESDSSAQAAAAAAPSTQGGSAQSLEQLLQQQPQANAAVASVQPAAFDPNQAINSAYQFLLKKDTASALPLLNAIIEKDPQNDLAYQYRGWCLAAEQKYDEALKDYFKASELNPDEGKKMLKDIALIYWEKENYFQSSSRYSQYLNFFPDDGEAHYNLAAVNYLQNDLAGSLSELDNAERLGFADSDGLREKIRTAEVEKARKDAQYLQGKNEGAEKDFAKAKAEFKGAFSWTTLIKIVLSLIFGAFVIMRRSRGKQAAASGTRPQPDIQPQGIPSGPVTLEGIFGRDRFYFSRRLSVTERYFVFDESGQHILFVERPILARNILASIVGIMVAILLFILSIIAVGSLTAGGDDFGGGLIWGSLVGLVVAVFGAAVVMSGMEKKRRVVIYRDETKQEKVLEIVQESKIAIVRVVYSVFGSQGNLLGKFKRNHFTDGFRRKLHCLRPDGAVWFSAWEDSTFLSILRRVLPLDSFMIPTNYNLMGSDTGRKLGEFNRTSALLDKHVLDISEDRSKYIDRRVALACAVLLDTNI